MHISLGGIVKGVTTGLETLVETGNPAIAAGAGAVACLTDKGDASGNAQGASQNQLLAELSAENPFEQQSVNALSSFAQNRPDFGSLVDPDVAAA